MPIVTSGLIGYWNALQGVSGTTWNNIAPGTTGRYNGTLNGGTIKGSDYVQFDGIDDNVDVGAFQAGDKGTKFEFEIFFDSAFDRTSEMGALYGSYTSPNYNFISVQGDGTFMQATYDGFSVSLAKNTKIKVNFAVDVTTNTESIYVNDVLKLQYVSAVTADNLGAVQFGGWAPLSYFFKGKIYSAKIYNRILSGAERSQNTTNGTAIGLSSGTAYTKSLNDSFAISEVFSKRVSRFKSFTESITSSENVTKRYTGFRSVSDSIPTSDSLTKAYSANRSVNDSVSTSDSFSKKLSAVVIDTVNTGDSDYQKATKSLNDTVVSADSLSSTKGKAVNLSDSLAITDAISKALSKFHSDNINGSDSGSDTSTKRLYDTITQSDILTVTGGKAVLLSDNVNLSDAISKAIKQAKFDTATISESFGKQSAQSVKVYDVIVSSDHVDTFLPNVPTYSEVIRLTLNISETQTVNIAITQRTNIELDVTQRQQIDLDL